MARAKPDLSPVQAFLEPLARLALRDPMIEALEAEEIAFYAEGLLEEGFRLDWRIHARPDAPDRADHVRLYLWEDGAAPPPAPDLPLLSRAIWPEPGA